MNIGRRPLLLVLVLLAGKLTGLLKDVLLAYFHGASQVTDAFFLASAVSSLLNVVVFAAVPLVAVPLYARHRGSVSGLFAMRRVLALFLSVSAATTILVFQWGDALVASISQANDSLNAQAGNYLRIMSLGFCLSTLVAFSNAVQSVDGQASRTYVVAFTNNMFFCAAVFLVGFDGNFSWVVASGVVSWALLTALNFGPIGRLCRRLEHDPGVKIQSGLALGAAFLLFLPAVISICLDQINAYVGVYFASVEGGHAITAWSYAGKVCALISSLFLVLLTATLFPRMADFAGSDDGKGLAKYLEKCLKFLLLLLAPVVVLVVFYSANVVELIFGRGRFSPSDQVTVATVLAVVLIATPTSLARDVLNRACFSLQMNYVPFIALAFGLVVNVLMCALLTDSYGLQGIAAALVVSSVANYLLVLFLVGRKLTSLSYGRVVRGAVLAVLLCFVALIPIAALDAVGVNWVGLALLYFGLYGVLLWASGDTDARDFYSIVWATLTRRRSGLA